MVDVPGMQGAGSERHELTPEQEELVLDIFQFGLDVVGIFEPTPVADGSNAAISLARRDWLGAGLSVISMLPYFGDVAKLGKIPKYAQSIRKAVAIAAKDAKFAEYLRPALKRLKDLLDDVPTSAMPKSMAEVRKDIAAFLKSSAAVAGPVKKAAMTLPAHLQEGFFKAMKLPPNRNPRLLRKHPGAIKEDALVLELQQKGFVQVKKGAHELTKRGEDSDIWVRRVFKNGEDTFEAIRIDRKDLPSYKPGHQPTNPGKMQAEGSPFGRAHHTLSHTSTKVPAGQGGGIKTNLNPKHPDGMVQQLRRGARSGDFSHWHLEEFPASPDNLAKYLRKPARGDGPVPGLKKFDPVGDQLDTRKYQKGVLHPDEQARLKKKILEKRGGK